MTLLARLLVILMLISGVARAEEPLVEVDFEKAQAIPGQPLVLRVTVLVPTWMPKPVVFPSFEAPNLRVRLPEGATGPVNRTVQGETWSGVSRRIQVTPMIPGQFDIPAQELIVTYAEPGQTEPVVTRVALDPIRVEGILPEGAEELDPFVAAEALELSSEVSEIQMPMQAGDSLTLAVVAKIEGTSPIFLPTLIPPLQIEGIAAYPAEPVLEETDNRGKLGGSRSETVSLVAQSGGSGVVPDISLQWYNLKTGKVETATLDGFDVSVDAPTAAVRNLPLRWIAAIGMVAALVALLLWRVARRILPLIRAQVNIRRQRIEASEGFAFRQARRAVLAKDMGKTLQTLEIWASRSAEDPRLCDPLKSALSALGAARYGPEKSREDAAWRELEAALGPTRTILQKKSAPVALLPPLNPTGASQ